MGYTQISGRFNSELVVFSSFINNPPARKFGSYIADVPQDGCALRAIEGVAYAH